MKSIVRLGCAALLAVSFTRSRAAAAVEEHGTPAARAWSTTEVLGSWTGSVPRAPRGDLGAGSSRHVVAARPDGGAQVLSSWTGAIPAAARDRAAVSFAQDAAVPTRGAPRVLASWTGSIRDR
jgi:hypothetical protein